MNEGKSAGERWTGCVPGMCRIALLALLLGGASTGRALADDACIDFKWDVSKERALFSGSPAALASGTDPKSAPLIAPNRLYKLALAAQDRVEFSAAPARKTSEAAGYAGLAILKVAAPGRYRIAVDLPVWIDVVSGGALVPANDFQGQHSCAAPHKIVEFELAGTEAFVLQFSNATAQTILLTVTASPPRRNS